VPNAYALHPWLWSDSEQAHVPPPGAGAVLDLRPEAEQAKASQSSGWGLFAWPDQVYDESGELVANMQAVPLDAISLGYGDCRELQPTTQQRDELKTRLGLSAQPSGATLIDTISDCLGALADPSGQNGPKPLLPTREGLEIHLAYHSRVFAQSFNGAELFATTAKGRANRIRDVLRSDLETANKSGGPELVAKVLGLLCDRWGVSYTQAVKWRNLIRGPLLAELLGKSGGKFSPKKPATSYSDDFNRADSSTLGAAWNYYFIAGTGPYESTFGISSNRAAHTKPATDSSGSDFAAYTSPVSSADHWVQAVVVSTSAVTKSNIVAYVLARQNSTPDRNFYAIRNTLVSGSSSTSQLRKMVSGTETNLGDGTAGTRTIPWTMKLNVSGSSLTGYDGVTVIASATDTGITGNLYGGIGTNIGDRPSTTYYDDWLIDDGVSAGVASRLLLLGVG